MVVETLIKTTSRSFVQTILAPKGREPRVFLLVLLLGEAAVGASPMPIGSKDWFVWQPPQDQGQAGRENCTMQAIISGVVGGGAGLVLGAILAPFNSNVSSMEVDNLPMREQFRRGFKEMGTQSRSWGKNLMVIGAVFSCSECFVEKTRARTDRWNPIFGGCITGGVLAANGSFRGAECSARRPLPRILLSRHGHGRAWCACCSVSGTLAAGPQAMAFGCAGFAAFSAAIDALGFGQFD
jgi:import inner membrane translocase subunit TIM22